jgi:ArsR family transcriptional regulator
LFVFSLNIESMTLREQAVVFKALGHPVRLAMVQRLALGECCVCELLELGEVGSVSGPTVSQHLLVLKSAGVVGDERRGQRIFYRLLLPCVAEFFLCMKQEAPLAMEVSA